MLAMGRPAEWPIPNMLIWTIAAFALNRPKIILYFKFKIYNNKLISSYVASRGFKPIKIQYENKKSNSYLNISNHLSLLFPDSSELSS